MIMVFQQLIAQEINNPILGENLVNLTGEQFFARLVPVFVGLGFVIGTVVFFFVLVLGAIQWITSGGDKASIEAARRKVTSALVGIFILLSIYGIINLIEIVFSTSILSIDIGALKL